MSIRPRRSVLYMPGANARALEKAKTLPADCLILDLEDAVAPSQKEAARDQVLAAVQAGGYGHRELVVRCNSFDTDWGRDDLAAFAHAPIAALCLPKVESVGEIHAVVNQLKQAGAPDSLRLWLMVETPRGVLNADAIAGADARIEALVMGTNDLSKELRAPQVPSRIGLLTSLSHCVLAARAHGLEIFDGVHIDLDDEAGLINACEQGRELGFDGKTLIHPKQLDAANRVFAPSPEQIASAEKIVAGWQQAEREGKGVVVVDGRLVEALHVEEAQRALAIARAIDAQASEA